MRRTTFLRTTVVAAALALAATGVPANAEGGAIQIVRTAATGFQLPEGARIVGTVSAPASGADLPIDIGSIFAEIGGGVPKAPPLPCLAKTAWARSGTALTGYLWVATNVQTGYTQAGVFWLTDNGDWDPNDGEGIVAYASKDCAVSIVMDWSLYDYTSAPTATAPECYPKAGVPVTDDETPGPFTQPLYVLFGMGDVPYFSFDPSLNEIPCYRSSSLVVMKAKVSYVEKNRGTKVLIGCYERTWPVTFAPRIGEDPTKPRLSWLTVGPASPESTCASGT